MMYVRKMYDVSILLRLQLRRNGISEVPGRDPEQKESLCPVPRKRVPFQHQEELQETQVRSCQEWKEKKKKKER